jgi:hypothetical protein
LCSFSSHHHLLLFLLLLPLASLFHFCRHQ